ncbi:MAG TPA: nitroreductase family deazaflavin-dependent oxidoreductase [Terriglobales bacterium]|nr:nitroreductase family deazaflavin-dependent oxidoreductase [Terriglobales bacterium]
MPAPRWLARFNLRVTNRVLGPLARRLPGMGFVIHIGRKSGKRYRTPVMIFHRDGRLIIALTYGPGSQWVLNVLAKGGCEFETQGKTLHLADPRIVHDEQRGAMPAFVRIMLGLLNVSDFLELTIV